MYSTCSTQCDANSSGLLQITTAVWFWWQTVNIHCMSTHTSDKPEQQCSKWCLPPHVTEQQCAMWCLPPHVTEQQCAMWCLPPHVTEQQCTMWCLSPHVTEQQCTMWCLPPHVTEQQCTMWYLSLHLTACRTNTAISVTIPGSYDPGACSVSLCSYNFWYRNCCFEHDYISLITHPTLNTGLILNQSSLFQSSHFIWQTIFVTFHHYCAACLGSGQSAEWVYLM